jgi:hypothetical protein
VTTMHATARPRRAETSSGNQAQHSGNQAQHSGNQAQHKGRQAVGINPPGPFIATSQPAFRSEFEDSRSLRGPPRWAVRGTEHGWRPR